MELVVSIVSGVAALIAVGVALRANSFAKRSLIKAQEANAIAKEANEYSGRAEARELERNDVDWDWRSVEFGVVVVFNDGQDTAYDVRAVAGVWDGPKKTVTAADVPRGGKLRFEFPAEAQRRAQEVQDASSTLGNFHIPNPRLSMGEILNLRITWKTEHGRPASWEPRLAYTDLGVEY